MTARLTFFALALAPLPALAQPAAVPSWSIVQAQSKLGFTTSMEGQAFAGSFSRWTARIRFDADKLAASRVTVVIDTASARTGDASRDEALPSNDWFASTRFPQAIFQATSFRALGGNRYSASGTLRIRDKTVPVTLPFALTIAGDTATMRGSATIDRRAFAIGGGEAGAAVAPNVRIDVAVVAKRAR